MSAAAATGGRLAPSKMLPMDVLRAGSLGLRARRARAALSALGVAIGIAALVAVLGISASSQANLLSQIEQLGTNLLTVQPGQTLGSGSASLPSYAEQRIRSMPGVYSTSATYSISNVTVRRNSYVDSAITSGISVYAADRALPRTLSGSMAAGEFISAANERYPVVVLGALAAERCHSRPRCPSRRVGGCSLWPPPVTAHLRLLRLQPRHRRGLSHRTRRLRPGHSRPAARPHTERHLRSLLRARRLP